MQYQIEIRTGTKPAVIEQVTVPGHGVADACREARELLRKRDGVVWVKYAGLWVKQAAAERMERYGVTP